MIVEFPGAGLSRLITINSELNGAIKTSEASAPGNSTTLLTLINTKNLIQNHIPLLCLNSRELDSSLDAPSNSIKKQRFLWLRKLQWIILMKNVPEIMAKPSRPGKLGFMGSGCPSNVPFKSIKKQIFFVIE
jgi:hypothetical protein